MMENSNLLNILSEEDLKTVALSILSLITIFTNKSFISNKIKKIRYVGMTDLFMKKIKKNTSKDFQQDIFSQVSDERAFFLLTGINTNQKSIKSYYNFKNKLGHNFTWRQIKNAKRYLKFNDSNEIEVNLPKWSIFLKNGSYFLALFLAMLAFWTLIFMSDLETSLSFKQIGLFSLFFLLLIFSSIGLVHLGSPTEDASLIQKRLDNIENNKKSD